jgi:glycosyltransferase involved in cell wall biosynthesis
MKISIITVCKNSNKTIEKAIKSVLEQIHTDFQYIIIDGKSNDNTLEIINRYGNSIDVIVTEPDKGIYNAMNKALQYVTGDVVYFLNSDDRIFDNQIFSDIENEFKKNKNAEIIYGNIVINENTKAKVLRYNRVNKKYFYKNTICHQAIFIKRDLFTLIGGFDESYTIHADVDWLMKAYFKQKSNFHYFDRIICSYYSEGFSSNPIYAEKHKFDRQEISAKYFLEAKIKLKVKRNLMKLGLYNYRSK